jgi:hypothetical protein
MICFFALQFLDFEFRKWYALIVFKKSVFEFFRSDGRADSEYLLVGIDVVAKQVEVCVYQRLDKLCRACGVAYSVEEIANYLILEIAYSKAIAVAILVSDFFYGNGIERIYAQL